MQTVAVIPVLPHGVLQLGSSTIVSNFWSVILRCERTIPYVSLFIFIDLDDIIFRAIQNNIVSDLRPNKAISSLRSSLYTSLTTDLNITLQGDSATNAATIF